MKGYIEKRKLKNEKVSKCIQNFPSAFVSTSFISLNKGKVRTKNPTENVAIISKDIQPISGCSRKNVIKTPPNKL